MKKTELKNELISFRVFLENSEHTFISFSDESINEYLQTLTTEETEEKESNTDGYDQLSDSQTHSYKFYQGTLDDCIEQINDLFKSKISEIVEDVEKEIVIYKESITIHEKQNQNTLSLYAMTIYEYLQSILLKLKELIK